VNPSRDWSPRLIPSCKLYKGPVPATGPLVCSDLNISNASLFYGIYGMKIQASLCANSAKVIMVKECIFKHLSRYLGHKATFLEAEVVH